MVISVATKLFVRFLLSADASHPTTDPTIPPCQVFLPYKSFWRIRTFGEEVRKARRKDSETICHKELKL